MNKFTLPEGFYPIKDFEDSYAISKAGEIMRIKNAKGARVGKILKNQIHSKRGYLIIRLTTKKISKTYDIHILMANTFLGRVDNSLQVCHNNGIKTDCRLENLRIDTVTANNNDRILHGTSNRGTRNGQNKYPDEIILEIRKLADSGEKKVKLSKKFNIPYAYIRKIINKERWAWL